MKNEKALKLFKIVNDINRHDKKYLHEDKITRQVRKAKAYVKNEKRVGNGIKSTNSKGVRTYKNFGIFHLYQIFLIFLLF